MSLFWLLGLSGVGLTLGWIVTGALCLGVISLWRLGRKHLTEGTMIPVQLASLVMLLSMMAVPLKIYDLAFLAPIYCLFGLLPPWQQALLFPGAFLLWRPQWPVSLLGKVSVAIPIHIIFTLGILYLVGGLIMLLIRKWQFHNRKHFD